ncbi:MAG: prolipoprotein diacylglyceryl transferase [Spirochaetae bacterium HGW-Spirochaetae-6]|nr:MAG: prolipoprotein diacylglyceryl transferase [Spirochaetae bacterium HGW-Spirochaetae-6]
MIQNIDPVILSFGPLAIRYYGLIYMSGFIIGYLFLKYAVKKEGLKKITKNDISDYIFYSVIFVVLGARIFEVIFYDPGYYFSNPLEIIMIHKGGLSFHGGFFGLYIYTLIFCRKKGLPLMQWGDYLAVAGSISLFLGRIANFLNSELPGLPVDNQINPPWYAIKFVRYDDLWRIPTQLLESSKNLLIFLILLFVFKKVKNRKTGTLLWLFTFLYGTFRFIIEFWKQDYQDRLWGLSMGHLLCLPMIIIGLCGLYYIYFIKPKKALAGK